MLARDEILDEMKRVEDPLIMTPLLEEEQVGHASIDIRLGHEFIVLRRSSLTHLDPTRDGDWGSDLRRSQQRVRIGTFNSFVLHPGDLVLGATLEYVSIPNHLAAFVEGRSSWGRLGLIIATASSVAPGFKGCITLELLNGGVVPLSVYPGMRIAQLVFQKVNKPAKYEGKYAYPTGPQFSRLEQDREMRVWSGTDHTSSPGITSLNS